MIFYERNTRTHSDEQIEQIQKSIQEFGFANPALIDENNELIAGHGRTIAAIRLGLAKIPAVRLVNLTEAQKKALRIADNKIAENSGWDEELLKMELEEIEKEIDLDLLGFDSEELDALLFSLEDGEEAPENEMGEVYAKKGALFDRFILPPFSILDGRAGYWLDRKRAWNALGIGGVQGRADGLIAWGAPEKYLGKPSPGSSVFDPVLCEVLISWFSPIGGAIVDPFAGGAIRGAAAAKLGRAYKGIDLREEQVESNKELFAEMEDKRPLLEGAEKKDPVWICGDSLEIDKALKGETFDFVFSCPPYFDLEEYSDDPRDLSNMSFDKFRETYFKIIEKTCSLLKEDRFACFVVGEVRDKEGFYRGFVNETIRAFEDSGLRFYNEIVYVTPAGTLPIRVSNYFEKRRKIGKTHQNVLVFVKGDPEKAADACGPIQGVDNLLETC